ncbi:MAG: FUSC family protein [Methylocystis sp.]|nr:FUSC family protein [Methylocystis sp.]MCA3587160.1 FUSC family protein [Methylocystis sp.]MCA3590562.1 FUSC family protein [Methylocystis sp.]
MTLALSWHWPRRAALLYCFKVAIAAMLGYMLALGGTESAVYATMSAALIVGASRGEDIMTSRNRVRGTLAGMVAGIVLAFMPIPPALAVAIGVGGTAYLCAVFGWGVSATRVGAALCSVMILIHTHDAIQYSVVRFSNTLIGIAVGLAVSYLLLPIRGREAVAHAAEGSLAAAGEMLAQLASARQPLPIGLYVAMLDRVLDLEKAVRDGRREFSKGNEELIETARHVGLVCAGALTAAMAHSDLCNSPEAMEAAAPLLANAERLAARAKANATDAITISGVSSIAGSTLSNIGSAADTITLQGLALGLRKIEFALDALGR